MTNNTAIIQKLNPMYWEQFQITKMGINTVDDLHLEIIIKNKGKNIVQSYKAIFCVREKGMFDQDESTLRDIHLVKKNVHEYKSSRRTKFFFEIDKEDLVWMFQHIDFIETPGVGICFIPADKYELAARGLNSEAITETVKSEEVIVNAVEAPEIEPEEVVEETVSEPQVEPKTATEAIIQDAVEDEVITEEEAEEALETEEEINDESESVQYENAAAHQPIAKEKPAVDPFSDLPF